MSRQSIPVNAAPPARHASIELVSRRNNNSIDEMLEREAASDAGSPVPLLTYDQATGAAVHQAHATVHESRRSMIGRLLPSSHAHRSSRLEVEVELETTDPDKHSDITRDIKPDSSYKGNTRADNEKAIHDEKVVDVDADGVERDISILDTIRAQRRRTRRRWITAGAVVFCVLLLTGAIYGAVVDATWKKYQSKGHNTLSSPIDALLPQPVVHMKGDTIIAVLLSLGIALISEMTKSSSASTSSNQEDVRVNGGRALNATALRGIQRVWAHSHNDEMQVVPLATALSNGFGSIEIDVWLSNPSASPSTLTDDLWIGHEAKDLAHDDTFTLNTVYLDPLLELLDTNNAAANTTNWVGLYPSDPNATVQLVFDVKDQPMETYLQLQRALEGFKSKGYLTTYDMDAEKWTMGPITVIGTGNTPIEAVYYAARSNNSTSEIVSSKERYIFYDAPLTSIHLPYAVPASSFGPAVTVQWTAEVAPMASSKFPVPFNAAAFLPPPPANIVLPRLKWHADQAASKGIRARWWGAARRPTFVRGRLWSLMLDAGNAWIGGDDLSDARRAVQGYSG